MLDSVAGIAVVVTVFAMAGFVKGVVSVGLPTVIMALLGTVMAPKEAAAMLVVPALVTNIWQAAVGPSLVALVKRLWLMLAMIVVGTLMSIGLLTGAAPWLALIALGLVLAAYGVFGLAAPRFALRPESERWWSPAIGWITGLICGATGVFVVPSVPYMSALALTKDELVQAVALTALVSAAVLGIGLGIRGAYAFSTAWSSLLLVLPALVGMYAGQLIRDRLAPDVFRRWFFVGLIGLGIMMFVRAWGH